MSDPNEIPLGPEPTPPPPSTFPAASRPVPHAAPPSDGGVPYTGPEATPDAKMMGMLAHLLAVTLIGPLLVYALKKDEHPFIADQSKEALNFSLSCFILYIVFAIITRIICFGVLLSLALFAAQVVLCILAAMKARDGIAYRYPLNIRFIK